MAKSDGSVIIDTRMDTKGFSSGAKKLFSTGSNACEKLSSGFRKLGLVVGAALSVGKIIQFGVESSKAARELSDALTGLQSVVEGQGRSFADAKAFIDEYTSDGLVPAANAITAYKNLASRGYDDGQIRQTMIALKDAATSGRRSALSMGDAVKSATEGLRNENSMLVDNAGVTKNVAKMWDDYAASIGTTANNLTQQQKIQAEVAGILEETKFQTGDAAKVSGTLSGQLQQLSFNFNNLKVAVGGIVNPIVQYVLPAINTAIQAFTRLANAVGQVVGLLFGKVSTSGGLAEQNNAIAETAIAGAEAEKALAKETESAGKAAKKALAGFDELNVLQSNTGGGGSGNGVGAVGGGGGRISGEATTTVEDTISPKLQEIAEKIKKSISKAAEAFEKIKTKLEPVTKFFKETVIFVLEKCKSSFEKLAEVFKEKAPEIEETIKNFGELVGPVWKIVEPFLKKMRTSWGKAMDYFSESSAANVGLTIDTWNGLSKFLLGVFSGNWSKAWSGIKKIFSGFSEWLGKKAQTLENLTGIPFTKIYNKAKEIFGKIKNAVVNAWSAIQNSKTWATIKTNLSTTWDGLKSKASTVFNGIKSTVTAAWAAIRDSKTWGTIKSNLATAWDGIKNTASTKFSGIKKTITDAWKKTMEGLSGGKINFSVIGDSIKDAFKTAINALIKGLNNAIGSPIKKLNQAIMKLKYKKVFGTLPFQGLSVLPVPKIPYLAKGAVIPPNAPFMAMLGDQRHGTNIEAPLSTIQEAVALVLEDMTGGLMAGFEATVAVLREILEAILGIEIGDTVIAEAVNRYNRKMAVVKGG